MIQTLCLLAMADLAAKMYLHSWWCLQKEFWNPGKWLQACVSTAKAPFISDLEDVQPWCAWGSLLYTASPHLLLNCLWGELIPPLQVEQEKSQMSQILMSQNLYPLWWHSRSGSLLMAALPAGRSSASGRLWRWTLRLLLCLRKLWGCDTEITF